MKRLFTVVFGLLLLVGASASGQEIIGYNSYDFDFMGGGARAAGMGQAFYAVSNDITGGSWNPAGIHNFDKPTIGFTYSTLKPKGSTSTTIFETSDHNHIGSLDAFSAFHFVAPLRIKGHPFVGSLNYTRNFDVFEDYTTGFSADIPIKYITPIGPQTDTLAFSQNETTNFEGGLYSMTFAFGTRLYKNYSFGVGINIYTGRTKREAFQESRILDFPYLVGQVTQRATLDQFINVVDTNKFSGVNYTIGFKYNGSKFDAGLIIRTPFGLKSKRQNSNYIITKINGLVQDAGTDTTYFNDILYKYEIPMVIGFGIQYHLKENFIFAADIDYSNYSSKKVLFRDSLIINSSGTTSEIFSELEPDWKNKFSFRVGTEYMKDSKYGAIPIRLGFGFAPIPTPSTTAEGDINSVANYNLSLGSGIHWSLIHLDFAYTYNFQDRSFYAKIDTNEFGDDITEIEVIQEAKDRNHTFQISFTGVF